MIYKQERLTHSYIKLSINNFNIYNEVNDRIFLKSLFSNLFLEGERLFFFFMREENLTEEWELIQLRKSVIDYFKSHGEYCIVDQLDDMRFTSVAAIEITSFIPNLVIDCWKLFYACTFFIPKFPFSLEDYLSYLDEQGKKDIDGIKLMKNMLADLVCIKGLGGDNLNICYNEASDEITNRINKTIRRLNHK